MSTRTFECTVCGSDVEVDDRDQSVACTVCDAWFHATTCVRCAGTYVAVGVGRQECPRCGERSRFDERRGSTMGEASSPLSSAISVGRVPRTQLVDPALRIGPSAADSLGVTLSVILWVAAVGVIVVGVVSSLVAARVVAHHGNVALVVIAILSSTAVWAAILGALAYLVERADEHSRALEQILRRLDAESGS